MKGKLFLLVGPSGSGKSSVLHGLKTAYPDFLYPLSATTRPIREGETDGDIYHFYNVEKFKEILLNSWHLLPIEKQQELIAMGIYPEFRITQI